MMETVIEFDLQHIDVKSVVRAMLGASGVPSLTEVARRLGIKQTTLSTAINTGKIRLEDFLRIAELCGFRVVLKSNVG